MTKIGYNDGYSNEDKETSLAFDYISETWEVWSTVPRHIRKLYELCNNENEKKNGANIKYIEYDKASKDERMILINCTLPYETNISFVKKRVLTDEQRAQRAKTLEKGRK
ncbi:hypothetical protein [Mammaliicoccus phage vB_MscM-PMS3]|nr:hypothetical protein [Mammaliicoccus phage vB_MscM-PMS3]WBF82121.1 hypothetical protein [Mammaliicoccus virus vB_MscM-PMS2]